MSKRKNRKSAPNLPQATLDRARKQADGEVETMAEPAVDRQERRAARRQEREARRSKQLESAQFTQRTRVKEAELTNEMLNQMLANPTKEVSEAELREQYSYVLSDLRNMGILAGALFVFLIALAQLI